MIKKGDLLRVVCKQINGHLKGELVVANCDSYSRSRHNCTYVCIDNDEKGNGHIISDFEVVKEVFGKDIYRALLLGVKLGLDFNIWSMDDDGKLLLNGKVERCTPGFSNYNVRKDEVLHTITIDGKEEELSNDGYNLVKDLLKKK